MGRFTAGLAILVGLAGLTTVAFGDARYTISELPVSFAPAGLNNQGQVVGNIGTGAVLVDQGVPISLGNFQAAGINDSGQIAATQALDPQNSRVVVYQNGVITDRGQGFAHAINANGDVATGIPTLFGEHAALISGPVTTDLETLGGLVSQATAINSHGQVVGDSQVISTLGTPPRHAFLYTNGRMVDLGTLPGGINSQATAINDSGHLVGIAAIALGILANTHAFLYENGTLSDLGTLPGGISSGADDINNRDEIVGLSFDLTAGRRAIIYTGGIMTDLNTLIDPNSGWVLEAATLINDRGQIVASGLLNGVQENALLTPIPEPAFAAFITACGALFMRRRAADAR